MGYFTEPISDEEWDAAEALEAAWENGLAAPGSAESSQAVYSRRLSPSPDGISHSGGDELDPLLAAAQQLRNLAASLPPPSLALTQRVRRLTLTPPASPRSRAIGALARLSWPRLPYLRLAAALALVMVAVMFFTTPGQRAMAALIATLNLGDGTARQVQVNVSPDSQPAGQQSAGARAETLASLDVARARVPYPLLEPGWLPADYALHSIAAVSYDGMPDWFPEPLYIETEYRAAATRSLAFDLTLRQFGVALGDAGRIRTLRFDSVDVASTQEVQINGRAGLLLTLRQETKGPVVRELVWQQGDVMIEILSQSLSPHDMLAVAAALR
jgi:hypothetical protein